MPKKDPSQRQIRKSKGTGKSEFRFKDFFNEIDGKNRDYQINMVKSHLLHLKTAYHFDKLLGMFPINSSAYSILLERKRQIQLD